MKATKPYNTQPAAGTIATPLKVENDVTATEPFWRHPSERVQKIIDDCRLKGTAKECPGKDLRELMTALCRYTEMPEKNIRICAGMTVALEHIAKTFLKKGAGAVIAGPVEDNFRIFAQNCGADVSYHYGPSPFSSDPYDLAEKIDRHTRMLFLANPSHPTGAVYSVEEIKYLLEHLSHVILVLDESYYEYYGLSAAALLNKHDNLIIVRTFAEAMGLAGYPCAYLMASARCLREIDHSRMELPSDLARVAAYAVLGEIETLHRHIERIRENMIYLSVKLRSVGISAQMTPTDLLLVRVPDPSKAVAFLRSGGIFVADLSYLPQMESHISIMVGDDALSAKIVELFEKMPEPFYRNRVSARARITLGRASESSQENHPAADTPRERITP